MHIPESKISEILAASDIVDVVSEAVMLKKSGRNFFGLCPFHSEKTGSFSVNAAKQIFYCFGCHAGGNALAFVMKYHGISFPEAVKMLARKYSIPLELEHADPAKFKKDNEREALFRLNKKVMAYYSDRLKHASDAQSARAYLMNRGISTEIVDQFHLGHSQDSWDGVIRLFRKEKVGQKTGLDSGLVIPRKQGSGFYDRFRNRLMFPIFDINMQVAGFGGRVMDDEVPKYLNSPETMVYHKGKILYGLHAAKTYCRTTGVVYIVEGYFDFLSLYQKGIKNCVATLGTALTTDHVRILKGYAKKMVLVFDSDTAGLNAAKRSIQLFLNEGVETRILVLPEGSDPDSFIMGQDGDPVAAWEQKAGEAKNMMEFLFDLSRQNHGFSLEGRLAILEEMKDYLVQIKDSALRSLYIRQVAEYLGIDEKAVLEKVREKIQAGGRNSENFRENSGARTDAVPAAPLQSDPREEQIITMMLSCPEVIEMVVESRVLDAFYSDRLRKIARRIIDSGFGQHGNVNELLNQVPSLQDQELIAALSMKGDWEDGQDMTAAADTLIRRIIRVRKKEENPIVSRIISAQKDGQEDVFDLLRQKQQELQTLHHHGER